MNSRFTRRRAGLVFRELRKEAGVVGAPLVERIKGRIQGWADARIVSADDVEEWHELLEHCPGHQVSQVWCSYCGDVSRPANV